MEMSCTGSEMKKMMNVNITKGDYVGHPDRQKLYPFPLNGRPDTTQFEVVLVRSSHRRPHDGSWKLRLCCHDVLPFLPQNPLMAIIFIPSVLPWEGIPAWSRRPVDHKSRSP